jgi:hypothetical protein
MVIILPTVTFAGHARQIFREARQFRRGDTASQAAPDGEPSQLPTKPSKTDPA